MRQKTNTNKGRYTLPEGEIRDSKGKRRQENKKERKKEGEKISADKE